MTPVNGAIRRAWASATLLVGAVLLGTSCTSDSPSPTVLGTRPAPSPAPIIDVSDLRRASEATGLTGTFAYSGPGGHIWTLEAASGATTQVTRRYGGTDFDPHWSPDGAQLVFRTERFHAPDPTSTGYDGIFVIRADGTGEHAVNPPGGGLFPEWSPDGRSIVFSGPRSGASEGLFAVRPDGSGLRDLEFYAEHVEWSPDGIKLLLDRNSGSGAQQNWDIWRATARLTDLTRLTDALGDDHFAAWSPDGGSIVFGTSRRDEGDVWLMRSDGTGQHPLLAGPGPQSAEGWLPDGRVLVADYGNGQPAWYLVRPDGTDLRSIPQLAGIQGPIDWIGS